MLGNCTKLHNRVGITYLNPNGGKLEFFSPVSSGQECECSFCAFESVQLTLLHNHCTTVEPPNSGRVGNFDDVPYSEVEP